MEEMEDLIDDQILAVDNSDEFIDPTFVGGDYRTMHQCNICNKMLASFKGLQQHSIIHTDMKPYECEVCAKSFRFKSNLFEHRSVHTGFQTHVCPYCSKTCRLKGNLKKHLRTHVTTIQELEEAWRPFSSYRRQPNPSQNECTLVISTKPDPIVTPINRSKTRSRNAFHAEPSYWVDKILNGELCPTRSINEKILHFSSLIEQCNSGEDMSLLGLAAPVELYECPVCVMQFMSRFECVEHANIVHPQFQLTIPFFCDTCMRAFADECSLKQHEAYHERVRSLAPPIEDVFEMFDAPPETLGFDVSKIKPEELHLW